MLWLVLSIGSALFVALKNALSRHLVHSLAQRSVVYAGFLYTGILTAVFLAVEGMPELNPATLRGQFVPAVLAASIVDVFALTMLLRGIAAADLSDAYPLIALTPVFLLGTSYLLLGEVPSLLGLAGILTIVVGSYLMRVETVRRHPLEPFRRLFRERGPRYMILTAALFSLMSPLFKTAVLASSPAFALTISQLLSMLWLTLWLVLRGELAAQWRELRERFGELLLLGVLNFVQAIGIFLALEMTLVAYVISVKRLSILLTVVFGYLFFRERGALRGAGAAVVMIVGVVLIGLG
jgi:drug/metabolite transporter (DMT)-like permease